MLTTILSDDTPAIHTAATALTAGNIVAFPTETVYGLGANAFNEDAVQHIFSVKGRQADNPLIVHICSVDQIEAIATIASAAEERLIQTFMPGPLSLALVSRSTVAPSVTATLPTVCIRIPDHAIAQKLLASVAFPIAAPSANRSGRPSPTTAAMVYQDLNTQIPYILDGGPSVYGIESTVVTVVGTTVHILRPGYITAEDIQQALGDAYTVQYASSQHLHQSPGTRYTHYAPTIPVSISSDLTADIHRYSMHNPRHTIAVLVTQETQKLLAPFFMTHSDLITPYTRGSQSHLASCAATLYQSYHLIEQTNVAILFVEALPESGLGVSIMNRVKKSAGLR